MTDNTWMEARTDYDIRVSAVNGSKDLCAAILATGKTHGPMTEAQQIAAIEYAHSVVRKGGVMVHLKREE
jgi:hypothetical protein